MLVLSTALYSGLVIWKNHRFNQMVARAGDFPVIDIGNSLSVQLCSGAPYQGRIPIMARFARGGASAEYAASSLTGFTARGGPGSVITSFRFNTQWQKDSPRLGWINASLVVVPGYGGAVGVGGYFRGALEEKKVWIEFIRRC